MLIAAKLFLSGALSAVWRFLSALTLWQAVSLALLLLSGFLYLNGQGEKRARIKAEAQVVKLADELKRISSAKNEQKIITRDRIVEVEKRERDAGKVAERIERAPVAPGCKTPPEIMGAGL